jgi:hypothetical protein
VVVDQKPRPDAALQPCDLYRAVRPRAHAVCGLQAGQGTAL